MRNRVKHTCISLILFVLLYSCREIHAGDGDHTIDSKGNFILFDTILTPFSDTNYKFIFRLQMPEGELSTNIKNAYLKLVDTHNSQNVLLMEDSLFCQGYIIESDDFNGDKVKDISIFKASGGRSNPTYYLFLVDTMYKKLIKVNGFEDLPWPQYDYGNRIITSYSLAGTEIKYSFFDIIKENQLQNLGHGFTSSIGDSTSYDQAIKKIKKDRKLNAHNIGLPKATIH